VILFHTLSYEPLAEAICAANGCERGQVEVERFPDGERYQRVLSPVNGRDVVIVGGTPTDADALELYDLASGVVEAGAQRLTLVIPYFGYATMERAAKAGEVVTAKTRARLFSSIPVPGSGSRVMLVDLHTEGIPYYFEGGIRPVHVYAKPVILGAVRKLVERDGGDFVVACTDAGRAKWVESLANDLGVTASFVFKRRTSGKDTEVLAVSAAVEGKHVVIYDDMIRTGGSLIGAARAYQQAGARRISAIATHGVLPGSALEKLRASGLFDCVVVTDTHPRALQLRGDFLQVASVAGLIADELRGTP
jgi:ribose-phosphate pyrophosphokinase